MLPNHSTLRVMVIESDPLSRFGLREYFHSRAPKFGICGEFDHVATAAACGLETKPMVVLIDPELDGGGGLGLLRRWNQSTPSVPCVARLRRENPPEILATLRAGARGIVLRQDPISENTNALASAFCGDRYFSPRVTQLLAIGAVENSLDASGSSAKLLSMREREVFRLLGDGLTCGTIAERLGIGSKTVQTHLARIKMKLALRTHSELRRRAILNSEEVSS
jgi:DNA-binding NarL/FixJ family response regulator